MEIRKEDFVKFRIVNTLFYALPLSFFDEEEEAVEEVVEVVEVEATITTTAGETMTITEFEAQKAIAKATKKAELEAELAALEE